MVLRGSAWWVSIDVSSRRRPDMSQEQSPRAPIHGSKAIGPSAASSAGIADATDA